MYKTTISKFNLPLVFAYFIPLLIILWFIASFTVNIPFWDQWDLVNLFEKVFTGRASFKDFFSQHNEHRIIFPKVIYTTLAFVSNWDVRYESYFSVLLVTITFLIFYKISTLSVNKNLSISRHLTNILTCILLFSLVQYENWLWGFQLAWFLVNMCLAIAVLIIALSNNYPKRLYLAAVPCFIASFSLAHGLLSWLAVIPSVASIQGSYKQKTQRVIVCILLFFCNLIIYLIGYQKPNNQTSLLFILKYPLATGYYFFSLLGAPIVDKSTTSTIFIGAMILLIFLLLTFQAVKISKPRFNLNLEVASWISIGLFAILFAFITTSGRSAFGIEHSTISRYTTCSILLIISVAHLWQIIFSKNSFITGVFVGLIFISSVHQIPQVRTLYSQRLTSDACLEMLSFMDGSEHICLQNGLLPFPHTEYLRKLAGTLDKIGFRKFSKDKSFTTETAKSYGYLDSPYTKGTPITISRNGTLDIAGWASLPDSHEIPNIILFSHGSNKSFFADALVNPDSPIVEKTPNSIQSSKVGWSANISFKSLPLGETVIKAWVYDSNAKQFVKLNGELRVNVVE